MGISSLLIARNSVLFVLEEFGVNITMLKDQFITVQGKRFHKIWLRDNCLCPKCRHPTSFQKLYDISERLDPPEILSVEESNEQLKIVWNEAPPHHSTFSIPWLLNYAYDGQSKPPSVPEQLLWDKAKLEKYLPQWHDAKSCNFESWSSTLFKLGFTLFRNMSFADLKPFLLSIAPILDVEYGEFAPVKTKPGANDLGETGYALSPHTDYPTRDYSSLLVCFYMVENSVKGGETILVDGFRLAQDFRNDCPDYFRILAETPIQFRQFYQDFRYFHYYKRPIFELNTNGEIIRVNFAHSHSYNWNLPFEQMELFYKAYSAFFRYVKNPIYHYCFPLQSGDCLLMYNSRILHGRTAFDSNSGMRHLEVAYAVWDYLTARDRFNQYQHLYKHEEKVS